MKQCIWCNKTESLTTFKTKAHIFPDSVGGKKICTNVCDDCNWKFGQKQNFQPSVDIAVKEIFNLTKHLLQTNKNNSHQKTYRFKSEYFNFNPTKRTLSFKQKYKLKQGFQSNFARSFRRGIYKIFLEERERVFSDGNSEQFNFIREFARYNLGDIPLYYLKPINPIIFLDDNQFKNPQLNFNEFHEELHKSYRLYTFNYGGYYYILHTNNLMKEIHIINYYNNIIKNETYPMAKSELIQINKMEDLDFRYKLFTN